jgi:hypothetical protein
MKITNEKGYPQALVTACEFDTYDRGESDITVTQLIGPPQIKRLREEHEDDLVEDVSQLIFALQGKAKHYILELAGKNDTSVIAERRFYKTVGIIRGGDPHLFLKLGGQIDLIDADGILWDYKETSVWTYVYNSRMVEWTEQLNVLRYLAEHNGHEIKGLKILGMWRDWSSKRASKMDPSYPDDRVTVIDIPMWSTEETENYIQARLALHYAAECPPCTDEERWLAKPQYAVMKPRAARAMRLFAEYAEAKEFLNKQMMRGLRIERRGEPDDYKRCKDYCSVSQFCPQFNEPKERGQADSELL